MTDDEHGHLDATYVLGALPPSERQDFERHLRTCSDCARSVRELAGLPGLLSRLGEDEVAGLGEHPPIPETVLPALLREAAGHRRRWRALSAAGALAAAAVVAVLALTLPGGPAGTAQPPLQTTSMTQIGQDRLSADLSVQAVAWGTRLSVVCTYRGGADDGGTPPAYSLVVHTRSGHDEQVATWRAVPGKVTTVDGATASTAADITGVEVRTTTGLTLLRLNR